MKTWHVEMTVVAVVLVAVALLSGGGGLEVVGCVAVLLSFGHAQVADRLAEQEAVRARPSVACHRWATRYLVSKEAFWCLYFVLHQSWSALAGVALFIVYPLWRKAWRRHVPANRHSLDLHPSDRTLNALAWWRLTSLRDRDQRTVDALRVVVRETGGPPTGDQA